MIGSLSTSTPSQSKITSSKRLAIIRTARRRLRWVAHLAAFDYPSSLVPRGGCRAHPDLLRQFLRHPKQRLAAIHFGPYLWGGDSEFAPQHNEIVEEVDALVDHRRPFPADRFDDDFCRFLGELLRHSREARRE